jgi:hypothetical protein
MLRLKGLVKAYYTEVGFLQRIDALAKDRSLSPVRTSMGTFGKTMEKRFTGKAFTGVLADLDREGFPGIRARCNQTRFLKQRMALLLEFVILVEDEFGDVEDWPTPILDPDPKRHWPEAVDDLVRKWDRPAGH